MCGYLLLLYLIPRFESLLLVCLKSSLILLIYLHLMMMTIKCIIHPLLSKNSEVNYLLSKTQYQQQSLWCDGKYRRFRQYQTMAIHKTMHKRPPSSLNLLWKLWTLLLANQPTHYYLFNPWLWFQFSGHQLRQQHWS